LSFQAGQFQRDEGASYFLANSEAPADEGKYALRDDEWSDAPPGALNAEENRTESLRARLAPPALLRLKGM
jgi:hypothetical protein